MKSNKKNTETMKKEKTTKIKVTEQERKVVAEILRIVGREVKLNIQTERYDLPIQGRSISLAPAAVACIDSVAARMTRL